MLKGGAEFQRQKVRNRATGNWNKEFLTYNGYRSGTNPTRNMHRGSMRLMDSTRCGWEWILQLQAAEDEKPQQPQKTWAAEFLLRVGESREFLGLWINSGAIHEAKRRRATQVITCSFPCEKWYI
jgi:hypothetical protein